MSQMDQQYRHHLHLYGTCFVRGLSKMILF